MSGSVDVELPADAGDVPMDDAPRTRPAAAEQPPLDLGKDPHRLMKDKQKQLEFQTVQEDYIRAEQRNLKREVLRAKEEIRRIQSVPLVIGQFLEIVDSKHGIVSSTAGSNYYVRILSTINRCGRTPSLTTCPNAESS
eukprot:Polyplicarium_translucidae@DN2752_c0_g1_i4.p1